jgi:hypothetical protein
VPTAGLTIADLPRLRDEVRARIAAALPPAEVGAAIAAPAAPAAPAEPVAR